MAVTVSGFLTAGQSEELHKSIIAYLTSINLSRSAEALRDELNIGNSFSPATSSKYEGLLEKKWTGVVRLHKRIMTLESIVANLRTELDQAIPTSKRTLDPTTWLPSSPARYTLQSHREPITSIAFHPIFTLLASSSEDCTIKIWDWDLGELERTLKGHTRAIMDLDFGGPKSHTILASCSTDLTIKLWDPARNYANTRTLFGHDHSVSSIRFLTSPGSLLVSASRDSSVRIWDVTTGYCVRTIRTHTEWVRTISPSFDGQYILSGGKSHVGIITDSSTGETRCTLSSHDNAIECSAFAPPSSYIYLSALAGQKKVPSATSSAEYVATGSRDKTIKIWTVQGILIKTLIGHDNWIRGLEFHPGGKFLISVGDDRTLRCWDLEQEGRLVRTVKGPHEGFVSCVRWAPGLVVDGLEGRGEARMGNAGGGGMRCAVVTGSVDSNVRVFVP